MLIIDICQNLLESEQADSNIQGIINDYNWNTNNLDVRNPEKLWEIAINFDREMLGYLKEFITDDELEFVYKTQDFVLAIISKLNSEIRI